jgi:prepilin-type N-terminal cleavage/methylation domain-containing protein
MRKEGNFVWPFISSQKRLSVPFVSSVAKMKNGFTLFEVMITLSILGVVVSLLYLTLHQSMAVMAETEDRAEVIRQGRMILEKMTGELRGAALVPPKESFPAYRTGLVGRSTQEGKDYLDRLDFTHMPHPWAVSAEGGWGVTEVGYSLDRAPGGKGFTLFRRQDEARDGDLLRGGRSLAICDRVRSLSFSYFDQQGKKSKEWNSLEGERRNQLPSRVEIDLRLEDSRGQAHDFRTQVFLPLSG